MWLFRTEWKNTKADEDLRRAMVGLNLTVPDGSMTVVQVDGGNTIGQTPEIESVGILYPGERMDVIFSNEGATSLTISMDEE